MLLLWHFRKEKYFGQFGEKGEKERGYEETARDNKASVRFFNRRSRVR